MLLDLLQLADSAFPIGQFSHSQGLETLVQEGWLGLEPGAGAARHEGALMRLLRARLAHELAMTDLPLLLAAHGSASSADLPGLLALDALAQAARPVREWRLAGASMGRRLLAVVLDIAPTPLLVELAGALRGDESGPQLPVAFGVVAQSLECTAEAAAHAFAFSSVNGQLAATVRLALIGQRGAQRVLHALKPAIGAAVVEAASVPLDSLGGSLPLVEIAGMRHERAHERLFAS